MSEKILEIAKIISNGFGLGRMPDGKVVMLPYVLPGETVSYKITRQRKDYAEALPLRILTPSPHRIDPCCPHFKKCGGCDFQHSTYDFQLAIKEELIREQLLRPLDRGGSVLSAIWQGVTRSPDQFAYRQRLRLHVTDHGELGFFRLGSNDLEAVSECPLACAEINEIIPLLRKSHSARDLLGISRELEVISSIGDNKIVLIFHTRRKPRAGNLASARNLSTEITRIKSIVLDTEDSRSQIVCAEGDDINIAGLITLPFPALTDSKTEPYALVYEAGGFSQVNHKLNQQLISSLVNWVKQSGAQKVLDMYCGMGNFSIPLAMMGYAISGFDQQRSSVRSAVNNCARYGLECNFFRAAADEGLKILTENGEIFDLLIIDPPRSGCIESIPAIIRSNCRAIIYVSCDPATLCRDLNILKDKGFRIKKIAGFDMFPQTRHLESMVMLSR